MSIYESLEDLDSPRKLTLYEYASHHEIDFITQVQQQEQVIKETIDCYLQLTLNATQLNFGRYVKSLNLNSWPLEQFQILCMLLNNKPKLAIDQINLIRKYYFDNT